MVLSGSKMTSRSASICNRTNVGGGTAKKAGLKPRVGWYLSSNVSLTRAPQRVPVKMVNFHITQTQRTGYRATIGGV